MENIFAAQLSELLNGDQLRRWEDFTHRIDELYEMERLWNKGFGDWKVEYKYRRGGKTLCTFYAGENSAALLITMGKAEREKFEAERELYALSLQRLYDDTHIYHDGKWLFLPLHDNLVWDDVQRLLRIKRRPNRK